MWRDPPGDLAGAVLGAEAFQQDPTWRLPLAATGRLIADGAPLSIVFTDSAPWVSILVKALGVAPGSVSVMGLVALLSFALTPLAFALLLIGAGVQRLEVLLLGTALGALLPAWYVRVSGHLALSSFWLPVLALAVAVRAVRVRVSGGVIAALCGLGALAIGMHAYLFVMVSAIAAGALFADAARDVREGLPRAVLGLALYLGASAASAWLLGYAAAGSGVAGFGLYSMNLLSPFVPQISGLRALLTGDQGGVLDATGGQMEGYNYLGAGILVTLGVGLPWFRLARRHTLRAALPLCAALAVLTALALSNAVYLGHTLLFSIRLPARSIDLLENIRASGRLFWPVPYALLALALAALDRVSHRHLAAATLLAALTLQAADTEPLRREARRPFRSAPTGSPALALWRNGPLAGHNLRLLPRFLCTSGIDRTLAWQVSLLALRSGARVEGVPVARTPAGGCEADQFAAIAAAPPGWTDLLWADSLSPGILAYATQSRGCASLRFGAVCGAALPPGNPTAITPIVNGRTEDMTETGDGHRLTGPGWSYADALGTWTAGHRAMLILPVRDWTAPATLTVQAAAFVPPPFTHQTVIVSQAGRPVATWQAGAEPASFTAPLQLGAPFTTVTFELPDAVSPQSAAGSLDTRLLGISLQTLRVTAP